MNKNSFNKNSFLILMKLFGGLLILFVIVHYVTVFFVEDIFKQQNFAISDQLMSESFIDIKNDQVANVQEFNKKQNSIKLGFVGDIMLDRGIEKIAKAGIERDFNFPFYYIGEKLRTYDILFGNLEGPVSDKGVDLGSIYSFRMDPKVITVLKKNGFDIFSLANNHIGDFGIDAIKDTLLRLDAAGIEYVGAGLNIDEAMRHKTFNIKGTKITYTAFSQFGYGYLEAKSDYPGVVIISNSKLKTVIEKASKNSDITIVSFHFGDEYQTIQNKYQEKIARLAILYGADLVIGHHPHVVQTVEKYKNKYIAYSLGNFIFDQNFSEDTGNGAILEVFIEDKKITEVKSLRIEFTDSFQPFLVE